MVERPIRDGSATGDLLASTNTVFNAFHDPAAPLHTLLQLHASDLRLKVAFSWPEVELYQLALRAVYNILCFFKLSLGTRWREKITESIPYYLSHFSSFSTIIFVLVAIYRHLLWQCENAGCASADYVYQLYDDSINGQDVLKITEWSMSFHGSGFHCQGGILTGDII